MKKGLKRIRPFVKSQFKSRIRSKKFLIWVIIMPMLLIGFLNLIGGQEGIKADVAVVDKDKTSISNTTVSLLKSENRLEIEEVDDIDQGIDLIRRGKVEALLVIPDDFSEKWDRIQEGNENNESINFKVYHAGGEQEELIDTVLKGITADINDFIEDEEASSAVELQSRSIEIRNWTFTDLLLPGGMMIVILQLGMFASSNNSSSLKENMIYKRLKVSPVPRIYSISGMVLTDALFTTSAGIIAMITGLIIFGVHPPILNIIFIVLVLFITSLTFSYLGCSIGWLSSRQDSAQGLSSMLIFPLIFFSHGYLFSMLFPDYVVKIAKWLPIFPGIGMFKDLLFYTPSLADVALNLGHSMIWLFGGFLIFLLVFKLS